MAESVTIDGVSKRFGQGTVTLPVLREVELTVAGGEVVAVVGPSGCGKSTLLRLVAGLDRPTIGEVRLGDRLVTEVDPRCAVVFQEPRLLPWRTVAANVALGARRVRDRAAAISPAGMLDLVGLADFGGAYPHQLSGGMAQRVALARALVGRPEVLLLDEPFASLDALTRMRMQDLLLDVRERLQPTVILVTHDVDEALYLADRVVVMGARPATVDTILPVRRSCTRDRGDAALVPLRSSILARFGLAHAA